MINYSQMSIDEKTNWLINLSKKSEGNIIFQGENIALIFQEIVEFLSDCQNTGFKKFDRNYAYELQMRSKRHVNSEPKWAFYLIGYTLDYVIDTSEYSFSKAINYAIQGLGREETYQCYLEINSWSDDTEIQII